MLKAFKIIWIAAIFTVISSLICFLISTTAFFNRGIDLVATVIYIYVWFPAFILLAISIIFLIKKKIPSTKRGQIFVIILIIFLSGAFSTTLFYYSNIGGIFKDKVISNWSNRDSMQITSDKKYIYQLELINLFQRNSRARLFIKNIINGEKMLISLDMTTNTIYGVSPNLFPWVEMFPSEDSDYYALYTTRSLKEGIEIHEINMNTRTSRRIE